MIDKKELEENSKTKFGKHTPSKPKPFIAFLGIFIRKSTPRSSFVSGLVWMGVLAYWWFQRDNSSWAMAPLVIWLVLSVSRSILGVIYWGAEKARLDQDIARCEQEIVQIGQEINERKQYFEKIREEIARSSQN